MLVFSLMRGKSVAAVHTRSEGRSEKAHGIKSLQAFSRSVLSSMPVEPSMVYSEVLLHFTTLSAAWVQVVGVIVCAKGTANVVADNAQTRRVVYIMVVVMELWCGGRMRVVDW